VNWSRLTLNRILNTSLLNFLHGFHKKFVLKSNIWGSVLESRIFNLNLGQIFFLCTLNSLQTVAPHTRTFIYSYLHKYINKTQVWTVADVILIAVSSSSTFLFPLLSVCSCYSHTYLCQLIRQRMSTLYLALALGVGSGLSMRLRRRLRLCRCRSRSRSRSPCCCHRRRVSRCWLWQHYVMSNNNVI